MANYVSKTFKAEQHKVLGDFHTHTVYSLHGMSSPSEVVQAAINAGLRYIAITDHFYPLATEGKVIPSTINQIWHLNQLDRMGCYKRYFRPEQRPIWNSTLNLDGDRDERANIPFQVLPGYEISVLTDDSSTLARATDQIVNTNDIIKILGFHSWYTNPKDLSIDDALEWVDGMTVGIKNYTFFAHPEREVPTFRYADQNSIEKFYRSLFEKLKSYDIPIEVNAASLRSEKYKYELFKWIDIAKEMGMMIIMNSDAHCAWDVGNLNNPCFLLDQVDYPTDLIINIDNEKIKQYMLKQ